MLLNLLTPKTVQVVEGAELSWQGAIRLASEPLVADETIKIPYVDKMIGVVNDEGPYMNIGPHIALAHARPDGNVNRIGLSLLKTNQDVGLVNDDHPVQLWFVLAAVDSDSHLSVIQELMMVLTDEETVKKLREAKTSQRIIEIVEGAITK